MKFIVGFIVSTMLVVSGAFSTFASGGDSQHRPTPQHGHAEDIFLTRLPAGAEEAEKHDQLKGLQVEDLVGTTVVSKRTDEELGKVTGVIVDASGDPLALVMHLREGRGIRARDVAVDWYAVNPERDAQDRIVLNVEVAIDQLRHAPEFVAGR